MRKTVKRIHSSIILTVSLAAAAFLATGCGEQADEPQTQATIEEPTLSVDTLLLTVTDTIGVEMGDSTHVFGMLMRVGHDTDGNILALDMHKACLSVFSPDGEFISYIGAPGPGPGEFQIPLDFAVFPEGGLAVTDAISRVISYFDPEGNYIESMEGFFPAPPMSIEGASGGSIIGQHMPMVMSEEMTEVNLNLSRWTDDPEPDINYMSVPMEMDFSGDGMQVQRGPEFDFAVGPDGSILVAIISDTAFALKGYTLEGEEFLSLHEELERTPMTQEEIDAGALGLSIMINNGSAEAGMDRMDNTYPWRNVIGSIGVDSQSRIWVELSYTDTPVFEVYDYSGELLFVAVPDVEFPQVGRPAFKVDAGGIIGFDRDPLDYPKLYILELQEN